MSIFTLSKPELKTLRALVADHVEAMTYLTPAAPAKAIACRLFLNPLTRRVTSHYAQGEAPAEQTPSRSELLLCEIREHRAEPDLPSRMFAQAVANLKAAGLLPAGSRFAA